MPNWPCRYGTYLGVRHPIRYAELANPSSPFPFTLLIVDDAPSHTVHLKHKRHHIVTYYQTFHYYFPFVLYVDSHIISPRLRGFRRLPPKHHQINISLSLPLVLLKQCGLYICT